MGHQAAQLERSWHQLERAQGHQLEQLEAAQGQQLEAQQQQLEGHQLEAQLEGHQLEAQLEAQLEQLEGHQLEGQLEHQLAGGQARIAANSRRTRATRAARGAPGPLYSLITGNCRVNFRFQLEPERGTDGPTHECLKSVCHDAS